VYFDTGGDFDAGHVYLFDGDDYWQYVTWENVTYPIPVVVCVQ
jgi:hypothetical protein